MSERDTHFQNFARLQRRKIVDALLIAGVDKETIQHVSPVLDRLLELSDYYLAIHVVESLDNSPLAQLTDRLGYHQDYLQDVPDLREQDVPDLMRWLQEGDSTT